MQNSRKLTRAIATSIASFGLVVAAMGAAQAAPVSHDRVASLSSTTTTHMTSQKQDTGW